MTIAAGARQVALTECAALVTGASSGIGRAIACLLASRGARVCLVGRDPQRLSGAAAEAGALAHTIAMDLTDAGAADRLADEVRSVFGGLDVLVHSAGIIKHAPFKDSSVDDLDAQLRANVQAPYAVTKALAPMLTESSSGDVVFINSSIVRHPRAEVLQFAATQHALEGVADCVREEFNPQGVRVLSVYPGQTATPRQAHLYDLGGRSYAPERLVQAEDVAQTVLHAISLPRNAEITEVHIRPAAKS